jgi:hypothetical protein
MVGKMEKPSLQALVSINDTSTSHDMQVIDFGIVRNHIPLLKPDE